MKVTSEEWDELFWKQLLRPVLLIGGIPFAIGCIIGLVLSLNYFGLGLSHMPYTMLFPTIWFMFVILIGLGAGGLGFSGKYEIIKKED